MRILDFPIVKLTVFLIAGILFGYYLSPPLLFSTIFGLVLLVGLFSLLMLNLKSFHQSVWFGILAFMLMVNVGIATFQIHDFPNYTYHYSKTDVLLDVENDLVLSITETLKSTNYHDKYVVQLLQLNKDAVEGKLLLNIDKDSLTEPLQIGHRYFLKTPLKIINKPSNPGQFDYNSYLRKQHILHQIQATNQELFFLGRSHLSIYQMAHEIRSAIITKLEMQGLKANHLAIFKALLLGQRADINKETYENYINAGAVHILAVSGLHIGIILMILQFVLRPLNFVRHGHILKISIIVTFLWIFAIIAGLSPSVTRAVTMFTAVTIAINLRRVVNIYNTLAVSVFILLLVKPMFLFDVGFQLSYTAVIAIVALQPLFYALIKCDNKILDYYWQLFTVTLAAQIGVLPLGLFYFHQFPGLFFISNLIIIPILGFVLGLGILMIVLVMLNLLPTLIKTIFGNLIDIMNYVVGWVATKEDFLFQDIAFNLVQLIASYLLIFSATQFLKLKSGKSIQLTLVGLILLQLSMMSPQVLALDEVVVFHKTRDTYIGVRIKNHLTILTDRDTFNLKNLNFLKDYQTEYHTDNVDFAALNNAMNIGKRQLLVVDSTGIYNNAKMKPDIILLRDSPRINLVRLIDSLQPQLIIADGSNYKSYVQRWKATSLQKKIPFHATAEKGSYKFKLDSSY